MVQGSKKRPAKKTVSKAYTTKTSRKKYDETRPKRGSLRRMIKRYLDIRISSTLYNAVGEYAYNLTSLIVDNAYTYAEYARRVTILDRDVEDAARLYGIEKKDYKSLSLGDLPKCDMYTKERGKGLKQKITRAARKASEGKKKNIEQYSREVEKVLRVDFTDLECVTLQKASFRKFVTHIMEDIGIDMATAKDGSKVKTRWSSAAMDLLQLIVEGLILKYAAGAAAIAKSGKRETITGSDFQIAKRIGGNKKLSF